MPITLPSYVAPNELIQSAWGNAVVNALDELDDEKADIAGEVFTGTIHVAGTDGQIRIRPTNDLPLIDFYDGDGVTNYGLVDATNARMRVSAAGDVVIQAGVNEIMRGSGTVAMFGKTATNLASSGVEVLISTTSVGSVRSSISSASAQNLYCRHNSSADANAVPFIDFNRGATLIGSVTQVSTTGVSYNTTSDARLKEDVGLVDGDGLATMLRVPVRRYRREDGSESVGMFAQELVDVIPEAVTQGGDDPDTEPWMVAYSQENIVGHLALAVQQLAARLAELESA